MKYSLTCKTDSNAALEKPIILENGVYQYEFIPNADSILHEIRISVRVPNPQAFQSKIEQGGVAGAKAHFKITRDFRIHNSIVSQFQRLESLLAFSGEVLERIRWDQPKEDVVFESEEERSMADIFSVHMTEEYDKKSVKLTQNALEKIVGVSGRFDMLIAPMAFWREGTIDYHAFRYINAFFNFYFILEGLYGDGKTKNRDVEEQFANSAVLRKAVEDQIQRYKADRNPYHRDRITKLLKDRSKELDVDGIIHLLVKMRGELHHFTNNPNRPQGTPFNHKAFHAIALLGMVLSTQAIHHEIVLVNKKLEEKTNDARPDAS